jgi:hypothetical protein
MTTDYRLLAVGIPLSRSVVGGRMSEFQSSARLRGRDIVEKLPVIIDYCRDNSVLYPLGCLSVRAEEAAP